MNPFLQAALDAIGRGWRVFPVQPGGKRPLVPAWQKQATTDEAKIRTWWKQWPTANIGAVVDNGVLDIDVSKGGLESAKRLFADHPRPETLIVKTQSGGLHFYFDTPLPTTAGKLGPGLDTRGGGTGYVVAPGSLVHGRQYKIERDQPVAPAPEWLLAALNGNGRKAQPLPDEIAEGEREALLVSLAGSMRARGAGRDAIYAAISAENDARCNPPLPDDALQRIAGSVAKYAPEPTAGQEFEAVEGAEPPAGSPRTAALEALNREYAVTMVGSDVVIMREKEGEAPVFLSSAGFSLLLRHRRVPHPTDLRKEEKLAEAWLDWTGRRQYEAVEFCPGETLPPDRYNLWRGWPIEPSPEGSCRLFLSHIRDVVCLGNDDHYRWMLNWFGHLFQFPQEKPLTVVALAGDQGVGKSIVGDILGRLLGPYLRVADRPEHIVGQFNAHLERCLLLQAEEAFWGGDKKAEGALKHLVTGASLAIERKGVDRVERPNYTRLLITSNNARVWPTALNDRRLAIFEVSSARRDDVEYFDALFQELEDGGYENLLHLFLTMEVDRRAVRHAPRTDALEHQAEESFTPEDAWLRDLLESGSVDGEVMDDGWCRVQSARLYESYIQSVGRNWLPKNRQTFSRFVQKNLRAQKGSRVMIRGLQSVMYELPPLEECRKEYLERGRAARAFDDTGTDTWISTNEFLHDL